MSCPACNRRPPSASWSSSTAPLPTLKGAQKRRSEHRWHALEGAPSRDAITVDGLELAARWELEDTRPVLFGEMCGLLWSPLRGRRRLVTWTIRLVRVNRGRGTTL